MKVRILDKQAVEAITPSALRAYVVGEGWQKAEPFGRYSEVYIRESPERTDEVIIPFTEQIADYAAAVGSAITQIARTEGRDELAVYADLSHADRDVIRVRAAEADDDGSIEIEPGVELVQHARDLLASAACSAYEARRAFYLGKVQQATSYMRRVRLGQTEHGSFVVTLLTPIPPSLSAEKQQTLWPALADEPYERKVTRILVQGLRSAHDAVVAVNRGEGLEAFTGAVTRGVSANLCESVASIIDQSCGADVSVTWARTRPAPLPRSEVAFGRADAEILREAGRQLRLQEPRPDEHILGYVINLHRGEVEVEGQVTIKALVDGRTRSLVAALPGPLYQIAIVAHDRQLPISVFGDLETYGRRWRLVEPRDLQIVDDTEPDDDQGLGLANGESN
jgi:hypothetical protein